MGYKKRTDILGGADPCTATNLFKTASGRSHGPFPSKSCYRHVSSHLSLLSYAGFSTNKSRGTWISMFLSDGLPQLLQRLPASCPVTFWWVEIMFYYQQLQQEKTNYSSQVWATIKQLMLGLSRQLIQLSLENNTTVRAHSQLEDCRLAKWQSQHLLPFAG